MAAAEFMHPLVNKDTDNGDPWKRAYVQQPPLPLAARTYQLSDFRPQVERKDYTPYLFLKSNGFCIVPHRSRVLREHDTADSVASMDLTADYHEEVKELVAKVTGAKKVIVVASVVRGAQTTLEKHSQNSPLGRLAGIVLGTGDKNPAPATATASSGATEKRKPPVAKSGPSRVAHMDHTPLGARQLIRRHDAAILTAAVESGVIAAEDAICEASSVTASDPESSALLEKAYNSSPDQIGPRYAAYSVWRPLKVVKHDPLALIPWQDEAGHERNGMVKWTYSMKIPGPVSLGGDYIREFAWLGAKDQPATGTSSDQPLQCMYYSDQKPDEVTFVSFFDSAALGGGTGYAPAPFHGSPKIVGSEEADARQSVEVRVVAFW